MRRSSDMTIEERAKKAIAIIDQQIGELDNIVKPALREGDLDMGYKRMARWKERTVRKIRELVSDKEGVKFHDLRKTAWTMYKNENFADEAQMYKNALISLKEELDKYPEDIFLPANSKTQDIHVSSEGLIIAGQYYDALKFVADILSHAKNSIVMIDRYIDDDILDLIPSGKKDLEIRILTQKISDKLKKLAHAFLKQYKNLAIRKSDVFHDRFVIIDVNECYHFGPSIDEHLGKRYAMFSRIQEPALIDQLKVAFNQEWNKAQIVIGQ